jgi:hypothetical protein
VKLKSSFLPLTYPVSPLELTINVGKSNNDRRLTFFDSFILCRMASPAPAMEPTSSTSSTTSNNNHHHNNNNNNNNNNSNTAGSNISEEEKTKMMNSKGVKLPPVSSISRNQIIK